VFVVDEAGRFVKWLVPENSTSPKDGDNEASRIVYDKTTCISPLLRHNTTRATFTVAEVAMRCLTALTFALVLAIVPLRADEKDEKKAALVATQKKAALDTWKALEIAAEGVQHESDHFIVMAPKPLEKNLKDIGILLEKSYDMAGKLLYKADDEIFPGKLTVYLMPEPKDFDSYLRRIEKIRVSSEEVGYVNANDDKLRVAVSPPRAKGDPEVNVQAAQQAAIAILQRKVGVRNPLPIWFSHGFGRATYYRAGGASDRAVIAERRNASKWATMNKRNIQDTWNGGATGEEANALAAGTMDFLAYGPGKSKFLGIVDGFKPDENGRPKTFDQALQAVELTPMGINPNWQRFIKAN